MAALFTSGAIVDIIIGFMAVEGISLLLYRRRTGQGVRPADLICNLLSGLSLLLALRAALVQAWWGWVAAFLLASLLTHLIDLRQRWRS